MSWLIRNYRSVYCVDLLRQRADSDRTRSDDEAALSLAFRNLLSELTLVYSALRPKIKYVAYDLQLAFRKAEELHSDALAPLLASLDDFTFSSKYFCYDIKQRRILLKQKGVFRVNCLDW